MKLVFEIILVVITKAAPKAVLVFCLLPTIGYSQLIITGKIIDSDTRNAIPYATISLTSNTKYGTVSNVEGKFRIDVSAFQKDSLVFRHIGYETAYLSVSTLDPTNEIELLLTSTTQSLDELTVFAEDPIKKILMAAFRKIEENYPQTGTLHTGFYRESNQLISTEEFLYFSESTITFYTPSYKNKEFGPVRIDEGGNIELPNRYEYEKLRFYAGVYVPQRFDFVKNREEFINPESYQLYDYTIFGLSERDSSEVYVIQFKPRAKGKYQGEVYIHKKSLAFTGAVYELSKFGIQKENQNTLSGGFKYQSRKYAVQYKMINNKWGISFVSQTGIGRLKDAESDLVYTNEYISTYRNNVDRNPIKESEAIPFTGIYTHHKDFSKEFWTKPLPIERTARQDSIVRFLLKRNEIIPADNIQSTASKKETRKSILIRFAPKISSGLLVNFVPARYGSGHYSITYGNKFTVSQNLSPQNFLAIAGTELTYHPKRFMGLSVGVQTDFISDYYAYMASARLDFTKNIYGWRRPVYIQYGIGVYHLTLRQSLGEAQLAESFTLGSKTINSNVINVSVGESRYGLTPRVFIGYKFTSRFSFFAGISASMLSKTSTTVLVEEASGFLFTRKSVKIPLPNQYITLQKNAISSTKSPIELKNLSPIYSFGLRFGY